MGIITAIVAAIRVGGSQDFRSLIGRATESRATVEADLMSSTSADVCELWSGEGVVRVLGLPALLQLIYVAEDKSEASAGIYTLPEAIRYGYYSKGTGPDRATEIIQDFDLESYHDDAFNDLAAFQARQSPPNLSLNVSIKLKNRDSVSKVVAPVGVILQGGVLIFAAVAQYKPRILHDNEPFSYGFPMFLAGTLALATGMFWCAQVVDSSTTERKHEPSKGFKNLHASHDASDAKYPDLVIWLQQGGQMHGDQRYESFGRQCPAKTIMTSERLDNRSRSRANFTSAIVAVGTSLFGFIAQFVALRAMHATITVAQLGAVLLMTLLRSFAHSAREHQNDIKYPEVVDGNELEWLAKNINKCKTWEVVTALDERLLQPSQTIAMDVMKSRARLADLSENWELGGNKDMLKFLQTAIEDTMNHVFTKMSLMDSWGSSPEFQWRLPVIVNSNLGYYVTLRLTRLSNEIGGWQVWTANMNDLEATLCLWTSFMKETKRKHLQSGRLPAQLVRLMGPATRESKMEYDIWINRGTKFRKALAPIAEDVQYLGWTGVVLKDSPKTEFISVICNDRLERLCAQDLYAWFMFGLTEIIAKVGGNTTLRSSDPALEQPIATIVSDAEKNESTGFRLINSEMSALAACYSNSGLGTIEDAYVALVPALRAAGILPSPNNAYSGVIEEARRLEEVEQSGSGEQEWEQALEMLWWHYHSSITTGASLLEIELEIKQYLLRLARRLSPEAVMEISDSYPPRLSPPWTFSTDSERVRMWDAVYMGWQIFPRASEDRAVSLFALGLACPPEKPEEEKGRVFQLVVETLEKINLRVLHMADVVLHLAQLALENELPDTAKTLAKLVWERTVVPWNDRHETRNLEATALLMKVYRRQAESGDDNKDPFLTYVLNQESMELAVNTDILTEVTASDIKKGQIPIELLVIRGSRTPLQWAAETARQSIIEQLLKAGAAVDEIMADHGGRTALQAAAGAGHEGIVKLLLAEGANFNATPSEVSGRTALQAAAEGGHLNIVQLLLVARANVNAPPSEISGTTALQAAAVGHHLGIVKLLLENKADVNATAPLRIPRKAALQAAAEGDHERLVKHFLATKTDINDASSEVSGWTALQVAAKGGYERIVKALLGAGADVDAAPVEYSGRTALQAAVEGGHGNIVKLLLGAKADINAKPAQYSGRTALQAAAERGRENFVELLLAKGAEFNGAPAEYLGRTALQAAAEGGYLQILDLLLVAGADLDAPCTQYGRTALQAAAEGGHESTVKRLLMVKADVNAAPARISGRTALQAAAEFGHYNIVRLLLKSNAQPNAAPSKVSGRTALQAATEFGHFRIVRLLLKAGANPNAEAAMYSGFTALECAVNGRHAAIVRVLLKAGAMRVVGVASGSDEFQNLLELAQIKTLVSGF